MSENEQPIGHENAFSTRAQLLSELQQLDRNNRSLQNEVGQVAAKRSAEAAERPFADAGLHHEAASLREMVRELRARDEEKSARTPRSGRGEAPRRRVHVRVRGELRAAASDDAAAGGRAGRAGARV
ncbi:hypothetical protein AB1Y20_013681 [Prymnesium parvum]|uniref:Uncharacterized protein n=1 Tax=Prymnesium parvum TaxID=97485 RepID=A0AB34IGF3_PRYPA